MKVNHGWIEESVSDAIDESKECNIAERKKRDQ